MPSSRQARIIRSAISPRFATRIFLNTIHIPINLTGCAVCLGYFKPHFRMCQHEAYYPLVHLITLSHPPIFQRLHERDPHLNRSRVTNGVMCKPTPLRLRTIENFKTLHIIRKPLQSPSLAFSMKRVLTWVRFLPMDHSVLARAKRYVRAVPRHLHSTFTTEEPFSGMELRHRNGIDKKQSLSILDRHRTFNQHLHNSTV